MIPLDQHLDCDQSLDRNDGQRNDCRDGVLILLLEMNLRRLGNRRKVKSEGCGGGVVGLLGVSGLLPTELRVLPRVAAFCELRVVLPEDDDIV